MSFTYVLRLMYCALCIAPYKCITPYVLCFINLLVPYLLVPYKFIVNE